MSTDNTNNEAVALVPEVSEFIADLTQPRQTMFCSYKAETAERKAILYNAMNNPEKHIADCVNTVINMKDVFCEVVTIQDTGEKCPRIVIIDDKGIGYQSVSQGVWSAMKKLIAVFGAPTWDKALPVMVKQITKGEKRLLTFDVVTVVAK